MLAEHWDLLEADFSRSYGVRLSAICFGAVPWSVRMVSTHIRGLPADSVFLRNLRHDWDTPKELLAQVVDAVNFQTYAMRVQLGHDREAQMPKLWPRPTAEPAPDEPTLNAHQILAQLGDH